MPCPKRSNAREWPAACHLPDHGWAVYQAKGIKSAVASAIANRWKAAGKAVPAETEAAITRYADEQTERRAHLDRLADRIAALGYTVADNL
jgi:ubiquinone biosynthesis protein UbiJ